MSNFLPRVCARAHTEILINLVMFVVTMEAFVLFFVENYLTNRGVLTRFLPGSGVERIVYNLIFAVFMFGSFTYQVSRLSFFWNVRSRTRAARESLARFLSRRSMAPRVEIVVPSYREESHVIWQTLMSAALVDYPNRGVVLLLDNPPNPTDRAERELLLSSWAQVDLINDMLAPIAAEFTAAADAFRANAAADVDLRAAAASAAELRDRATQWLERVASEVEAGAFGGSNDHTRAFFVSRILREPAQVHRARAQELRENHQTYEALASEFDSLATMFSARLSLFERKNYVNLSHLPTKAANLNSYISIMGRRLTARRGAKGLELVAADAQTPAYELIEPPDAKYVIILDADSFLLPDYATAMVAAMESPGNERAAVMQTPYTAIPDTPHMLERAAGATTDIYFYVTEGMGFANAGFWVGASATIRKEALLDIATVHEERGYTFPVYIQDKTVIEDTGATIDLVSRGWRVENYPARLSYSATPADFGALVVQRRRWANGGLIILPSLLRHLLSVRPTFRNTLEGLLRLHYLIMPACISISMLLMLVYPFDFKRVSSWIYLTLPPYLYLVCRDLRNTGYRRTEIFRAYSLFVVLLPVVLTGVANSLIQIVFRVKAQFGRTPKIDHRTAVPLTCTATIVALFGWSVMVSYGDYLRGDGMHAIFAFSNACALGYGIVALIGLGAIAEDFVNAVVRPFRKLVPISRPAQDVPAVETPRLRLLARELVPPTQSHAPAPRALSVAELPYIAGASLQPAGRVANDQHVGERRGA
jgi:cellulose synthase/poly-beta-1,6-N-acetylglucosamine synthase-like glycosyltransferase